MQPMEAASGALATYGLLFILIGLGMLALSIAAIIVYFKTAGRVKRMVSILNSIKDDLRQS